MADFSKFQPVSMFNPQRVEVELHWNRYVTNEALDNARAMADRGDLPQARQILDTAIATLGASPLVKKGDPICLGLLTDLQEG